VRITSTRRAAHTATLSPAGCRHVGPTRAPPPARPKGHRRCAQGNRLRRQARQPGDAHARGAPEQREQPLLCGGIQKKAMEMESARGEQGPVARTRCPASRIAPRGTIATNVPTAPAASPASKEDLPPPPSGEGWGGGEDRGGEKTDEGSPQISKRSKRMNALREIPIWKGFPLAEPYPTGFLFRQMSVPKSQSQTAILVAKLNPFPRYTREWCIGAFRGR